MKASPEFLKFLNIVVDNCPLGDQRGVLSDFSQTCADYVADNPYRCYPDISSYVSKSCCGSCAAIHTGVQGVYLCIFSFYVLLIT